MSQDGMLAFATVFLAGGADVNLFTTIRLLPSVGFRPCGQAGPRLGVLEILRRNPFDHVANRQIFAFLQTSRGLPFARRATPDRHKPGEVLRRLARILRRQARRAADCHSARPSGNSIRIDPSILFEPKARNVIFHVRCLLVLISLVH